LGSGREKRGKLQHISNIEASKLYFANRIKSNSLANL
jgi:hypothetical protein